jgi:isoleucyl-tRNA synthetase
MQRIAIKHATPEAASALADLRNIFLEQANAKDLVVLGPTDEFPGLVVRAKPDPAAIGKAYKALQQQIVKALEARPVEEIRKALESGPYTVGVDGQVVTIDPSMVRFEMTTPADVVRVETPYGELFLDLRVTPGLREEAYARELIRRVQQMRKEIDLEVDDFIVTVVQTKKDFAATLKRQAALIARETHARKLTFTDKPFESEYTKEWRDVDGHLVTIGVTPLHMSEAHREFTQIPGISRAKATALFDAGYKSVAALRGATKQELAQIDGLDAEDVNRIPAALAATKEAPAECPTCGAPVPSTSRRCPRCGEPVASESTPPSGNRSRAACIACGALIPAGAVECPSCGAPRIRPTESARGSESETLAVLKDSSSYLVKEAKPEEAYRLFLASLGAGKKGMVITRLFPRKVRERFGLSNLPIVWLSNVGKGDSVRPKDLEKLSLSAEQFLVRERGVILLDAVEYLVTNNNFLTVLRLVQAIRDQAAVNNGVLLLSVNPSTLDAQQMTLLEREVDRVVDPTAGPASA